MNKLLRSRLGHEYPTLLRRSSQSCLHHAVNAMVVSHDQAQTTRLTSSFSKQTATAPLDVPTNYRWRVVPPANLVHLAIGGVYVYSMWTPGMTQALGVIAPYATDWSHAAVLPVFSTSALCLGVTTARLGQWVEQTGPRRAALVGSAFWSSGLLTTAVGVHFHSLPLVYCGWGLLGGIGWGFMYLAPVTTVMKWFPDQRGLATGIALSAFGAGAAIAPSLIQTLMDFYATAPQYIGPLSELTHGLAAQEYVTLQTLVDGTQVVAESSAVGTPGQAVVVATEAQAAQCRAHSQLAAGAYELGTGSSGTAPAMATLGVIYGIMGTLGARFMSLPHPKWKPTTSETNAQFPQSSNDSQNEETADKNSQEQSHGNHDIGMPVDQVMKTKQFPLLWLSVFGNATGGLALLSSSKLMVTDLWTSMAPDLVTTSFATAYVSGLGIGMAAGRFGWSAFSDYFGNRRNTYALFGLGIPIMGLAPAITHAAVALAVCEGDATAADVILPYLYAFCGGSVLAISFYGGVFSVLPAYIADLFGQKHAGAIHGKLLTAWAASAVAGPMGLAYLRDMTATSAIHDLLPQVQDSSNFESAFGCSLEDTNAIQTLIDAKTITIARLMEIVPSTVVDPTPFLYDTTCYAAAGLMTLSFVANLLIQPIDVAAVVKKLEKDEDKNC